MKNKDLILTLVALSSLLAVACNKQNNSKLSNDSINSGSDSNNDNQALYNRIILDYYEQMICKNMSLIKRKNAIANIVNDKQCWMVTFNGTNPVSGTYKCENLEINGISLSYILEKSSHDGYIFFARSEFINNDNPYLYINETLTIVNGETIVYPDCVYLPMVWHNGKVLFPSEAYELGIISIKELKESTTKVSLNLDIHYDKSVSALEMADDYYFENTKLSSIQEDYYQFLIDNETPNIESIKSSNIRVIDSFGQINDKELLVVGADGILFNETVWNEDLTLGDKAVKPFNHCQPLIYYKNCFFSIEESYMNGILKNEDIDAIIAKYN